MVESNAKQGCGASVPTFVGLYLPYIDHCSFRAMWPCQGWQWGKWSAFPRNQLEYSIHQKHYLEHVVSSAHELSTVTSTALTSRALTDPLCFFLSSTWEHSAFSSFVSTQMRRIRTKNRSRQAGT